MARRPWWGNPSSLSSLIYEPGQASAPSAVPTKSRPGGRAAAPVRTGPSSDDPHDVVYFRRHSEDDPSQAVSECLPGQGAGDHARGSDAGCGGTTEKIRGRWLLGSDEGRDDGMVRGPCRRTSRFRLNCPTPTPACPGSRCRVPASEPAGTCLTVRA